MHLLLLNRQVSIIHKATLQNALQIMVDYLKTISITAASIGLALGIVSTTCGYMMGYRMEKQMMAIIPTVGNAAILGYVVTHF